jgi:Rieske 2Fe-2S family protein
MTGALEPTLDRAAYLDHGVFAIERDRIFAREWCVVGRATEARRSGDFFTVELVGESLIIVRGDDHRLRAFFNVCRHRGAQLIDPDDAHDGHVAGALRCPYHSWTYGLDGALKRAPFLDDIDVSAIALHEAGCEEWGGFVFICFEPHAAPSLADQLGAIPNRVQRYPLSELVIGTRIVYAVAANWKVIAENYNECYHCGSVHPALCDVVPAFRARGGAALDWDRGIPHRDGAWTLTRSGTTNRAPFPGLDEIERTHHKGELAYPNFFLSLAAEHVAAFALFPVDAGHTRIVFDALFHPDAVNATDFDPSDAVDLWDITNREDWRICERVQRGMQSRTWQHGFFAPMEDLSLDLRRWYEPRMARVDDA